MAADSMAKASTHKKLGPGPLWHTPGLQLPAYIQHVAASLMKSGMDRSRAIAMAVGIIKNWAAGKPSGGEKRVDATTVAAARKALAEWEAAKAKARATSNPRNPMTDIALAGTWDPSKHPRAPKGASNGGKFSAGPPRDAKAAEAQKNTKAAGAYDAGMRGDPKAQAAALKAMSDADLQALSKYAYSFKSSDPKVVQLRIQIANALAKRGMNVKDYGALGGGTAKPAAKPAAKKAPAKKAPTKKAAAVKKPQAAPTPKK